MRHAALSSTAARVVALAALAALAWLGDAWAAGPAEGLIVRLRNPVAHEQRDEVLQRREAGRWGAVLQAAALAGSSGQREPLRRAVGRDQHLLDFGRSLPPDEAERLAARLRKHPDVQ